MCVVCSLLIFQVCVAFHASFVVCGLLFVNFVDSCLLCDVYWYVLCLWFDGCVFWLLFVDCCLLFVFVGCLLSFVVYGLLCGACHVSVVVLWLLLVVSCMLFVACSVWLLLFDAGLWYLLIVVPCVVYCLLWLF